MEARRDEDALLVDFLSSVVDYLPVIPDELAEYYLNRSGFQCPDLRVFDVILRSDGILRHFTTVVVDMGRNLQILLELRGGGMESAPWTRLISIATQKFISEIVNDAFQLCKLRQTGPMREKKDKQSKEKRFVLTTEDLSLALREYGVNIKRQEYYTDSPVEGASSAAKEKPDE